MKRLVGLFAACAAALGGFAAEGDRVIDGETVTVAAEADLGADVTRVLLRNGGELAFTNSLWVAKTYAVDGDGLNATGVVSVAAGQTIVANASPSPRSIIIFRMTAAICRSVMPASKDAEASFQISQTSRSAARSFSVSSGVLTMRSVSRSPVRSTNFAFRGATFANER